MKLLLFIIGMLFVGCGENKIPKPSNPSLFDKCDSAQVVVLFEDGHKDTLGQIARNTFRLPAGKIVGMHFLCPRGWKEADSAHSHAALFQGNTIRYVDSTENP